MPLAQYILKHFLFSCLTFTHNTSCGLKGLNEGSLSSLLQLATSKNYREMIRKFNKLVCFRYLTGGQFLRKFFPEKNGPAYWSRQFTKLLNNPPIKNKIFSSNFKLNISGLQRTAMDYKLFLKLKCIRAINQLR